MNISLLSSEGGTFEGAVGVIRDISGCMQVEQELRETVEFLESVFKASVGGNIVGDQQGKISVVNDATENNKFLNFKTT